MVRMVLVAGRRAEVYAHPDRRDRRRREQVLIRSLDSLAPDANARDDITVRVTARGYYAKAVQPSMRLGPGNSAGLAIIRNLPRAIASEPLMSARRRKFLLERLPYWRAFDRAAGLRIRPANYWE